jgi:hypothetical protein
MPFESLRSFFGKKEGQTGHEQSDEYESGLPSKPFPDNQKQTRPMEEINKDIREFLERDRRETEEINRSAHESLVKRAPEILKQQALERLPAITKTLRRALSYASEAGYAQDHIRIPEGDLTFWHYYDLEESLMGIETWRDYLSQEALDEISRQVSAEAETVLRILNEYRSWGTQHEPYTETQRNAFDSLWILHALAPDVFPRSLITLTDQEFEEIGTKQIDSAMDTTQRLVIHAKLAEYDPERFRAIFGTEYPPQKLSGKQKGCERRDWQEPLKVPKWSHYLRIIEGCMAASKTNPGDAE